MTEPTYLSDQFLIAMPGLQDPNFFQAVTYVCDHNDDGAMGIIINHTLEIGLGDVFDHMEIECDIPHLREKPVLFGGPVQRERGFILHYPDDERWESTMLVSSQVAVTTSPDILEAMAQDKGPEEAVVALGFSGWSAGQLEEELSNNFWLSVEANDKIIFDTPFPDRWTAAAGLLGIDPTHLSNDVGHA